MLMKKIIVAIALILMTGSILLAQESNVAPKTLTNTKKTSSSKPSSSNKKDKYYQWSIGIHTGIGAIDGDQMQRFYRITPNVPVSLAFGVNLEYDFNPLWGILAEFDYIPYSGKANHYPEYYPSNDGLGPNIHFNGHSHQISSALSFNLSNLLLPNKGPFWDLYINLGAGVGFYGAKVDTLGNLINGETFDDIQVKDGYSFIIPIGFTLEINPTKWLGIFWQNQYSLYQEDNLESSIKGNSDDRLFFSSIGLRWKIKNKKHEHVRNITMQDYLGDNINKKDIDSLKKQLNSVDKQIANNILPDIKELKDRPVNVVGLSRSDVMKILGNYQLKDSDELPSIYFPFDKYYLTPEARAIIALLASKMLHHLDLQLRIEGFCDNEGTEAYNKNLSTQRAQATKNRLVNLYQIDPDRITISGEGKLTDPKKRYLPNRRCDFYLNK